MTEKSQDNINVLFTGSPYTGQSHGYFIFLNKYSKNVYFKGKYVLISLSYGLDIYIQNHPCEVHIFKYYL